jgi:hypothetical protein
MAPRTFINEIDSVTVYTSPKCSCRSVSDFIWEVKQKKQRTVVRGINVIVFRNPYRRLVSGYLNKYVEHDKYMRTSLEINPTVKLDTFESFVDELYHNGLHAIDVLHFSPQIHKYAHIEFDHLFNSEKLEPLRVFINSMFATDEAMPVRVNQYGVKNSGNLETEIPFPRLRTAELLDMIKSKTAMPYNGFYTDDLMRKVRKIYEEDFSFIGECHSKGVIDWSLHNELMHL